MEYTCIPCEYTTTKKTNYERHMLSIKHSEQMTEPTPETENIQCHKCQKQFQNKYNLKIHEKSCRGVSNSLECRICHKAFNSIRTRQHHEKSCKEEQSNNVSNQNIGNDNMTLTNSNLTNNQTIDNHTTNNTNNITINNFGSERIDYIPIEKLKDIANNVKCIEYLNLVHFNEEHPENHNIKLHSNKQQLYLVVDNNKWGKLVKFDMLHCDAISNMVNVLQQLYDDTGDFEDRYIKFGPLLKAKSKTRKHLSQHMYCQVATRKFSGK